MEIISRGEKQIIDPPMSSNEENERKDNDMECTMQEINEIQFQQDP